MHDRGEAYVESRGPLWGARALAFYAIRHCSHVRLDWSTIRDYEQHHVGRWRYRFQLTYRRM